MDTNQTSVYLNNGSLYIRYSETSLMGFNSEQNMYVLDLHPSTKPYILTDSNRSYLGIVQNSFRSIEESAKKVFGENAWMTPECFAETEEKLMCNLVMHKCYLTIRFPFKQVFVDPYPNDEHAEIKRKLSIPIRDLYIKFDFNLEEIKSEFSEFEVRGYRKLIGYQAGFHQKYGILFPHLAGQNAQFCLGDTALYNLMLIIGSVPIERNLDNYDYVFNFLDIYLGFQSNPGGPYRRIEVLYENNLSQNRSNEYFEIIRNYYFLCVPREEWQIETIVLKDVKNKRLIVDYNIIDQELLFEQIDRYFPEQFKFNYLNNSQGFELQKYYHWSQSDHASDCRFRFQNEFPSFYTYTEMDGFYQQPVVKDDLFIHEVFKSDFLSYLNSSLQNSIKTLI